MPGNGRQSLKFHGKKSPSCGWWIASPSRRRVPKVRTVATWGLLVSTAWLANATDTIRFGSGTLILPYRPALPHRQADHLEAAQRRHRRDRHRVSHLGSRSPSRGRISDRTLAFIRGFFDQDEATANGQTFQPRPARSPIYIGGGPHCPRTGGALRRRLAADAHDGRATAGCAGRVCGALHRPRPHGRSRASSWAAYRSPMPGRHCETSRSREWIGSARRTLRRRLPMGRQRGPRHHHGAVRGMVGACGALGEERIVDGLVAASTGGRRTSAMTAPGTTSLTTAACTPTILLLA